MAPQLPQADVVPKTFRTVWVLAPSLSNTMPDQKMMPGLQRFVTIQGRYGPFGVFK
jgi:hypothetical protein